MEEYENDLNETGQEGVEWIHVIYNRIQWRNFVNMTVLFRIL